jgi:hypothetical protein
MYICARAFISILHDDQSTEMQTSSFAFCLSATSILYFLSMIVILFLFSRCIVLVTYGMSTNPIYFH